MEEIVGTVVVEDRLHALAMGDAHHDGLTADLRIQGGHHQSDVVLRCLGLIDENQLLRVEARNLPHNLGADAARRTGDHHLLAGKHLANGRHVDTYLVTRQQILDLDGLELFLLQHVAHLPLLRLHHHQDLHAGIDELVLQSLVITK